MPTKLQMTQTRKGSSVVTPREIKTSSPPLMSFFSLSVKMSEALHVHIDKANRLLETHQQDMNFLSEFVGP